MNSFVGPFPTRGVWTAVGLSRGWFLGILGFSVACFVLLPEPVWLHPRATHFGRIGFSYAVILPAVVIAVRREHPFPFGRVLAATAVIALMKLVVTAMLLVAVVAATS